MYRTGEVKHTARCSAPRPDICALQTFLKIRLQQEACLECKCLSITRLFSEFYVGLTVLEARGMENSILFRARKLNVVAGLRFRVDYRSFAKAMLFEKTGPVTFPRIQHPSLRDFERPCRGDRRGRTRTDEVHRITNS
jgi:hypothetical protein